MVFADLRLLATTSLLHRVCMQLSGTLGPQGWLAPKDETLLVPISHENSIAGQGLA